MAELLGTGEVQIVANVEKALQEIDRVSKRLTELQSEFNLVLNGQGLPEDGGGKGKGKGRNRTPTSRDLGEYNVTPQLKGELSDIPFTIDASGVAGQLQEELNKHTFKIKIELDTASLQEMVIPVKGQMSGMAPGPAQHTQQQQANMVTNAQRDVVNKGKGARNVDRLNALALSANVPKPASGNVDDIVRFYQDLISKHNLSADMTKQQMAEAIGVPQTALGGVTKAIQGIAGSAPAPVPVQPVTIPPAQAIQTGHATRAQREASSTPARGMQLETSFEVLSAMDQLMGEIFAKAEYQDERSGVVSQTRSPEEILRGIYGTYSSPSDTRRSPIGRRKSGSPSVASPGRSSLFGGGMYYQGDLLPTNQRGPFFADEYMPDRDPNWGGPLNLRGAEPGTYELMPPDSPGYPGGGRRGGLVATNAVAGYSGGPSLSNRITLDPKTGKASGDLGPNPLLGGFGLQIGKNRDDVVDLTPLARFASTGTLAQMFSQGGELGLRTEGANAPTGAITGQQTILKRLIRGVVRDRFGQGVEDQLTEEALQPVIDNYFKPFLEVGNRTRALLNLGDQPNIVGATTLGGTSVQAGEAEELRRMGGFRYGQTTEETYNAGAQGTRMGDPDMYWDPATRTYKTSQPVVGTTDRDAAAAERQNRYENRERIRLGNRLPQDVAQRLGIGPDITIEELGKVVAQRAQIQENEPAFQQFINDMTKVYGAILDPNNIPTRAVEAGGFNPLGNPVLDEQGNPVMEERMVHGTKQMVPKSRFDVQPGDEFTRQSFINNSIHRILTATDLPAQLGVGTLQPRASGMAGQFAQKSPIISAMIRAITAKFYDTIDAADVAASEDERRSKTGETLLTGDEFGALAAQVSGTLPIDPKRAKSVAEAIGISEGLNSLGAGVVAVTIASPVPLPVTIVSGAAGGGGGDDGPPRKTKGGGGDDGGDDGKPDPSQPNDNINPKTGYPKGSPQDQAVMGRRQREEDSKRQQELFAANEQNRNRAPSEGRKTETIGTFDSIEAARKARDQVQAVAADAELQIKRRGDSFELRRRINPAQSQVGAELQSGVPKTEADRQREFEKGLREQEQIQARQEKARVANETRAVLQQQRAADPLRGATRQEFNQLYPGLMIDGEARQGPLTREEQRSFDEQYNRLRRTAQYREQERRRLEGERDKAPSPIGALSERELQALAAKRGVNIGGQTAAAVTPEDILREGESGEGDPVLEAQQRARAGLRSARGRIPQRALSTSIVQIAENLFGGVEKPLARIAAAEQEYTQLSKLATKEQEFVRKGRGLQERREGLKELLGRTPKEEREERMGIIKSLRENKIAINENNKEIDTWSKAVSEQTQKVEQMAKEAVGATDIFRNLGAGFIGGVGGAIVSQAVSQIAGMVMQVGQLASPTLDVMLGSGQTGIRRQQELAQVYAGSGFSQSALNQEYVSRGFTSGEIERFSGSTSVGAQAIARANQLNERLELLRAESAAMSQQRNSPAGAAASYGAGAGANLAFNFPLLGQVDIGGSDSVAKVIGGIINQSMDRLTLDERIARSSYDETVGLREDFMGWVDEFGREGGEAAFREQYTLPGINGTRTPIPGITMEQIDAAVMGPIEDAFADLPDAVDDFLNTRLEEAGSPFRITPGENQDLYDTLAAAGNQFESDLLPALRNNKLQISRTDNQPFNLQDDFGQFAVDLTQPDPASFAENLAGSKGFQNALETFRRSRQREYVGRRITTGFQSLGNQIIGPGNDGRNLGIAGGVGEGFTREYQNLANQAQEFENQGVEMMKALMPSQAGLLDEYTALGDRLKELNSQSGRIKADQAMRSYALSVKQARFAVEDLQGLTGKGEGSEIGRLERTNMLMQRRLQLLQFEQQQRSINFQVAVAGFQAEGMTGAERAARLQHARREAAVQQEMLNLNRGMFGNQVQIVDQRNIRSLEVATDNLNNIIQTFDENNKLAKIGARATLIQRNMQNLQGEWQHALQTIMAIDEQRTEFMRTVGDETEALIKDMDKTVTDPFDKAVEDFGSGTDVLADSIATMESNVVSPFVSGVNRLSTQVKRLDELVNGSGDIPSLNVRDITINQKVTGTVVDYKELVDMIVEELGKQGIRTGNNTGGR